MAELRRNFEMLSFRQAELSRADILDDDLLILFLSFLRDFAAPVHSDFLEILDRKRRGTAEFMQGELSLFASPMHAASTME